MRESDHASTRGIVHAAAGLDKFSLNRFEAGPELQPFVEHYWIVRYRLDAKTPFTQKVLSYPNVHLAFEEDDEGRRGLLYGIPRQPFVRVLRGSGRVLGVKFRSGGFYPFWQKEVSQLTGRTIAASELFGPKAEEWMNMVLDADSDEEMAQQAEMALAARVPHRDDNAERTARLVEEVKDDRQIVTVERLAERSGISVRQLQRMFRKYVGVTPKWVIQRFRLQEAAERLERDETLDLAELAIQLGYFDQAHFIKDFRNVLGQPPSVYRRSRG